MKNSVRKFGVAALLAAAVLGGSVATTAAAATSATPSSAAITAVSADAIVKAANGQVGVKETGNNCNPYGPCESWCALFATWTWNKGGSSIPRYAFTGDIYTWGQKKGVAHSGNGKGSLKAGDIVLYGTGPSSTSTSVHTGVVTAVSGTNITTVEGNSGNAVTRHGPFDPAQAKAAGRPANIYGYVTPA